MVQKVVDVVEITPDAIVVVQRPRGLVGGVEIGREAAEESRHREVGLTVAHVHRGIECDRGPVGQGRRVAAPEVAVQQRLRRCVGAEERAAIGREALAAVDRARGQAVLRGQAKLRGEAPVAPERKPVVRPAVGLRRAADEVVARPAETLLRHAMQRRQRAAEGGPAGGGEGPELEPFEQQPGVRLVAALLDTLRHTHGAGSPDRGQPLGLGGESRGVLEIDHLGEAFVAVAQESSGRDRTRGRPLASRRVGPHSLASACSRSAHRSSGSSSPIDSRTSVPPVQGRATRSCERTFVGTARLS